MRSRHPSLEEFDRVFAKFQANEPLTQEERQCFVTFIRVMSDDYSHKRWDQDYSPPLASDYLSSEY